MKTHAACASEEEVELRYLGTGNLRLYGHAEPFSKYHLINHSEQRVEFQLLYKEPVPIVHPHSVITEQRKPDGNWAALVTLSE